MVGGRTGVITATLVAAATLVAVAAARDEQTTAPAAAHVVPTQSQVVPLGTKVAGDCMLEDGRVDGRASTWELSTVIPAFKWGGAEGGVGWHRVRRSYRASRRGRLTSRSPTSGCCSPSFWR